MTDTLKISSNHLKTALEEYMIDCTETANLPRPKNINSIDSQSLFNNVITELELITNYEKLLVQAKAALNRARNTLSPLVLIHALPLEIMTRIFELVFGHTPPCLSCTSDVRTAPRYPELLSHVCHRWRHVALGVHRYWSHIDIMPSRVVPSHVSGRLDLHLDRNEAFAARTGQTPLEIHVVCGPKVDHRSIEQVCMSTLCTSIAARARSLRIFEPSTTRIWVFGTMLAGCTPGILEELVLNTLPTRRANPSPFFIEADGQPEPKFGQIGMSKERLRALLRPIKYLSLNGCYFPWTSKAYHGLVELRIDLPDMSDRLSIEPSRFEKILVASPKLRVLVFRFGIKMNQLVRNVLRAPVMLDDLEVLSLRTIGWSQFEAFLSFISPGPKLRRVFVELHDAITVPPSSDLSRFCGRSNVTELCIKCRFRCMPSTIVELFRLSPRLRVLTLANFWSPPPSEDFPWDRVYRRLFAASETTPLPSGSHLNRLNLFHCKITPSDLKNIYTVLPIHAVGIELSTCGVSDENRSQTIAQLSQIFDIVEPIVSEGFSEYWDPGDLE